MAFETFTGMVQGKKKDCILVFRYRESSFRSGNSFVRKETWTMMKRMSVCYCDKESVNRHYTLLDDADEADPEYVDIVCKSPQHEKLYTAHFVGHGRDYWTGNIEDWHWEMTPYEPEEEETKI